MDIFGNTDPRLMPSHLFFGSIHKNYETAIRADVSKQNFTVCPRHWYIDVVFKCEDCEQNFVWAAVEQQLWFEEYGHYVDAQAKQCRNCRFRRRRIKNLKKEYDQIVASARGKDSQDAKIRVISIIDTLESIDSALPERMGEIRDLFRRQVYKEND